MNELKNIFNNLIYKEIYKDIDFLIAETDDLDEIPIVSRLSYIKKSFKNISSEEISNILLGIAFFLSISARSHIKNDNTYYFNCLTFHDWDVFKEFNILIPNILYTHKSEIKNSIISLRKNSMDSLELNIVKKIFKDVGFSDSFVIFEEKFDDGFGYEIKRIYAINKNDLI